MSGNTVCFRTPTKSLTLGFVEGTNSGNDRIQLFCCIRELWKWLKKNPPLYVFYQQINNSVSVSASPSVVIASGQLAVSDTDGVLKPGGWGGGQQEEGSCCSRLYSRWCWQHYGPSSCLLRWWKMVGGGKMKARAPSLLGSCLGQFLSWMCSEKQCKYYTYMAGLSLAVMTTHSFCFYFSLFFFLLKSLELFFFYRKFSHKGY